MALYEETSDTADTEREVVLPPVDKDAELNARDIIPEQHFTEPAFTLYRSFAYQIP